jgi:ankyrin repeat protein
LLAKGASTAPVDRMNKAAIVYAAGLGHAGVVDALLGTGIDVNTAYEHQLTLLMWAAGQGQVSVVKLLLSRGAKLDLRDDRGMSALDIARDAKQLEAAALLSAQTS